MTDEHRAAMRRTAESIKREAARSKEPAVEVGVEVVLRVALDLNRIADALESIAQSLDQQLPATERAWRGAVGG